MTWTSSASFCQSNTYDEPLGPDFLDEIRGKDTLVDHVLNNRAKYRFQFMLTEITEEDSSTFTQETYDYSRPDWYFYPASMVKLPTALLTLEKLNEMDFSTQSVLKINRDFDCGNMKFVDESLQSNLNFEHMLRELIIVSNNTYYNSLYHFLTPKRINEALQKKGLFETNIYKDFSGCEMPLNLRTHSYKLEQLAPKNTYFQEESRLDLSEFAQNYAYDPAKLLGSKHEYRGEIVDGPFDFNYNLEYPIKDIHGTMMRLFFPQFFGEEQGWNLRESDQELLFTAMKSVPRDLNEKKYQDLRKYPDNLYKYIIHGNGNASFSEVETYGKIGISYGFVTESVYLFDPSTQKRLILSASIYVNANDTVNDGKYEYDEIARPFLARFSQLLLER